MSVCTMLSSVSWRNVTAFSSAHTARQSRKPSLVARASTQPGPASNQDVQGLVSRREGCAVAIGLLVSGLSASPAQAFLGFGGPSKEEVYLADTQGVLTQVKSTLALDRDDPAKVDSVAALRKQTNDWVAKYRRDTSFAGRPSYGNTYSALNALAGHFNSFGVEAPLPKKRLERVQKEIDDAERMLGRGR